MERKYSIREIDELRVLVGRHYDFGWYEMPKHITSVMGRSYNEVEKAKVVEERLRTIMMAGLTADDLRNEIKAE